MIGTINDEPALLVQAPLAGLSWTSSVDVKIAFDRVLVDSNQDWDAADHSFTPTLPGWYLFVGEVVAASVMEIDVSLYKDDAAPGSFSQSVGTTDMSRCANFAFIARSDGNSKFDLRARIVNVAGTAITVGQATKMAVIYLRGL